TTVGPTICAAVGTPVSAAVSAPVGHPTVHAPVRTAVGHPGDPRGAAVRRALGPAAARRGDVVVVERHVDPLCVLGPPTGGAAGFHAYLSRAVERKRRTPGRRPINRHPPGYIVIHRLRASNTVIHRRRPTRSAAAPASVRCRHDAPPRTH